MLTKSEVASLVVGLVQVNDADLIDDDSVMSTNVCVANDRQAIRKIRDLVKRLYSDFDFLDSPTFGDMTGGKSKAYRRAMERRFSAPEKRTESRAEFAEALAMLLCSDRAYELTPREGHSMLDEIRGHFVEIGNPEVNNFK